MAGVIVEVMVGAMVEGEVEFAVRGDFVVLEFLLLLLLLLLPFHQRLQHLFLYYQKKDNT